MSNQTLITPEVVAYLDRLAAAEPEPLRRLCRASRDFPNANWVLSPSACNLLRMLIRLSGARRVLELGTYVGCSATAIALALPPDGSILTCDRELPPVEFARKFWARYPFAAKIDSRVGPAKPLLDELTAAEERFDFAFVDADKPNYLYYFQAILPLLNPGGFMAFDNVLWHGLVADPPADDKYAVALARFNETVTNDRRVETVLLPLGDGLTLLRKV